MPLAEQFRALLKRFFPKKRKKRKTEASSSILNFLEKSRAISIAIFGITVAAIVITSFVGIRPSGFQFLPNQLATIRIVAAEDFTYQSAILTDKEREQLLTEVPPVYRTDMTYFDLFSKHVNELVEEMDRFATIEQDLSANAAQEMINEITERFNQKNEYRLSESDLATVLEFSDPETRRELIETGLTSLRESYKIGIYDKEDKNFDFGDQSIALFKRGDQVSQSRMESSDDALTLLRVA
ncbi:MAG: hypothetical protein MKZ70_04775, partial [Opitutales bacterium]|nr:hypothetical protein [Opitutales bacterium]